MFTKGDARRAFRNPKVHSAKLADGSFTAPRYPHPIPKRIEPRRHPFAFSAIQRLLFGL